MECRSAEVSNNMLHQGDFWSLDFNRDDFKNRFPHAERYVRDPNGVETVFAGRPFLLVRSLLGEQKKMNNQEKHCYPKVEK